ncbi:PKD-like domain-containing protein, partial [Lacihabitans soyangensis]
MRTFSTTAKITSYLSNALSMLLGFFINLFQKTETPDVLKLSIYKGKGYLKAWVLLLLLGVSGGVMGQTTLMSWDMSTQTGTAAVGSLAPGFANGNLATSSGALTRGAGVTPSGLTRAWGGSNWEQTGIANLSSNKNITFNVTPKSGFAVSLSSINPFSYRRSGTGPSNAIIEATANSVTSGISQGSIAFGNSTNTGADITPTVNLGADNFLQNIKGPITFNLSPYGATSAAGTLYIFDVANSTAPDFSITGRILGTETLALTGFETCFGIASASQTFTLKGDGLLAAAVNLTAPTGFEISTDNISYSGTLSITPSSGSVNNLVYVRIKSTTVAGSYSGDLTIIGGGFTADADLKVALSGVVNPTPTAAVLSGTATICEGSSTNLAVAITGGTSPFSVVYNDGSVNFPVPAYNSGANIPVSPISSKTYTLVSVTDAEGCVVASPSGGATVTVNTRPTSGVIVGNATICSGQSTNLTVTIAGGASPFQVVYSDGSTNTTLSLYTSGSNIAVSPTSTTTYTIVSITDANGCTVASPSGSAVVTVNPTPSAGALSGTATICSDASTNLGVAITGGTSPFTIVYSGGTINSYISTAAIPVSPASTTTYTLTSVTDANGCTVASPSGSAVVTVNQRPTAAAILGTTTICSGLGTSLVVNITDGQSPFTVVHSGGTVSSYISGSPIMITPTSTTTYTIVSVTDANGCTVATPTGSAVVTVNPTPVGTNTTLPAICSGTSVGYDLTTNVAVNSTYSWVASTPPPFITGASTTAQTGSIINDVLSNNDITGNFNVVYTVTPTSVVGSCIGSAFTVTVPIKMNLVTNLNGSASNSSTSICSGESTNLVFFSLPFLGAASIDYSDGSSTSTVSLPSGGVVPISVSPTTTTTYTLQSITANGCTKALTGPSRTVTVNPLPTGTLTATETSGTTPNDNIICSGDAVTFTAPLGYSNYNFKVNGLSEQSGNSNTYTASFSGDVTVTVEITSADNCIATLTGVNITVGSCGVTNVTRSKNYATIQQAIDHSSTQNGDEITVASGTYNELINVNKPNLVIRGVGLTKPILTWTGTTPGDLVKGLVTINSAGATIENFAMNVDLSKLNSAIAANGTNANNLTVKDNIINPILSGAYIGGYGRRNAININYRDSRVSNSNPTGILISGNTVTYNDGGTPSVLTDDASFRSALATDEAGLTINGNTFQTPENDIEVRFGGGGNIVVTNNNFNGNGARIGEFNGGAGTINISGNTFTGTFLNAFGKTGLTLFNNFQNKATTVSNNTFTGVDKSISLENYRSVTINNNTFTPSSGSTTFKHLTINTKEFSSSSGFYDPNVDLVLTNNKFNGSGTNGGTALGFYNNDNNTTVTPGPAPVFGTFTLGTVGNENEFASGIASFIYLDNNVSTLTPGPTQSACWSLDLNAGNNKFDLGTGLLLPSAMDLSQRTFLETKLTHKPDNACLGNIRYYFPIYNETQNTYHYSIQEAIDAVSTTVGDVISVPAGTYNENINVSKRLTLKGVNNGTSCSGTRVAESIINGATGVAVTIAANGVVVDGFTINGSTGVTSTGFEGPQVRNNIVNVGAVGISINNVPPSSPMFITNVQNNCLNVSNQVVSSTPTVGILLNGITSVGPINIGNNNISGGFYGYLVHKLGMNPMNMIINDTISGTMQGIAVVNTLDNINFFPSYLSINGVSMTGFTGSHPSLTAYNHHAGIYAFTGGASATNGITLNVNNVTIDGTGKPNQSSAGIYLGDFSTSGTGPFQTVNITNSNIINNKNRGLDARGRVLATISNSVLTNNGNDAFGSGNDGFTIISQQNSQVVASNNTITLPATSTTKVFGLFTGLGTTNLIEAHDNSILLNGNASTGSLLARSDAGTGNIDATCNWWGGIAGAVSPLVLGNVTFEFFRTSGTDTDGSTLGFQPASGTCNGCSTGNLVTNTTTGEIFCTIQGAIDDVQTLAGHTLEIASGTYDEQVLVTKGVNIKGVGTTKPIINFTGTVSGKPTLFDVSVDGAVIDSLNFKVDLSKLRSAVIASAAGLDNIIVKNNTIEAYGTPAGSYGDRNAVSVNYSGSTNYRVATGGVNSVTFTGNSVSGTPSGYFRSAIAIDEGAGTITGNTLQTINHDVLVRFNGNGIVNISNNNLNGGGIELSDQNAGSGTLTVSNNIFTGVGAPGTAMLRVKNNYNSIPHIISANTFTNHDWAVSLENTNAVTLDANIFNTSVATAKAVVVNTKSLSSNSSTITQVAVGGTFTNNNFNGTGNAIMFLNHDSDNDSYGTFLMGTAGNENNFASTLSSYIAFDGQTGTSTSSAFPTYPGTGGWPTAMACWDQDLNAENNRFDVGAGLQLPSAMNLAQRTTLESKLTHDPDLACLGKIQYFKPVHNFTQNLYYTNIQPAINAANPNDVIKLAEWTFNERAVIDKSLTIEGLNSDKSLTVIDGTGLTSVGSAAGDKSGIKINSGVTGVIIKNLTLQNFTGGGGNADAGIYAIGSNNNLMVTNVALKNNVAASGFYANGPVNTVSITNSLVENNGSVTSRVRGIVIWNGFKQNITITGNTIINNDCCGIELSDGTASAVNVSGNTVIIGSGDNALGINGLRTITGNNTINTNIITGGGRFGIELKNPSDNDGGANTTTVSGNTVTLSSQNSDVRDRAGIAVFRRFLDSGNPDNHPDAPNGVIISGNNVSGYQQTSNSEGFGIVVEGENHTINGNILTNNDIGIQQQAGHTPFTTNIGTESNQANLADLYFGRGNSPTICNITVSGNTFSGNTTDERIVTGGGIGAIVTTVTPTVDDPTDQIVCEGGSTTAVTFTGNSLPGVVYNWTNSNTAIGLAASGTGNIAIFTANNTATTAITATITVTPNANGCSGTPQTFTVTVNPKPEMVDPTDLTVCSDVEIDVDFTDDLGTVTTYAWSITNPTSLPSGLTASSPSGTGDIDNLKLKNTTATNQTVTITVTPTSAAGCAGTAQTFTITVKPEPVGIASVPTQTVCSDASIADIELGTSNSLAGTTYSWTRDNTNVTGLATTGTANITGIPNNVTGTSQTVVYTITPTTSGCVGATFTASITVKPEPVGTVSIASQTVCSDAAITTIELGTSNSLASTTYSWTRDNITNVTGLANTGTANVSGTPNNVTGVPQTIVYTITPTTDGCVGNTFTVSVVVNPEPVGTVSLATQTVCSDVAITTINLGTSNMLSGVTYSWSRDNTTAVTGLASTGTINITGIPNNVTGATQTVVYTITPSVGSCVGNIFTTEVLVKPEPVGTVSLATQTVCSDVAITDITLGTSNSLVGTTYSWTRDKALEVTGLASSGTTTITGTPNNVTGVPQTITYTITPTTDGCIGNTFTATVIVNPEPVGVATLSSQTVCSDIAISEIVLSTSNSISGTTYTWTRDKTTEVTGLASSGSGNIIGTPNNITGSSQTVTYTITPTSGTCVGNDFTATVIVKPEPVGVPTPLTQTVCSDDNITPIALSTSNSLSGTTYSWTRDKLAEITGLASTGTTNISGSGNNVTLANQTVTYTITPTYDGCIGNTFTSAITIKPEPNPVPTTTIQKCSAEPYTFDFDTYIQNNSTDLGQVTYTYSVVKVPNLPLLDPDPAGTSFTSLNGEISNTITNFGTNPITVRYTATPLGANGCVGTPFVVNVVINPAPIVNIYPNGSDDLCAGDTRIISGGVSPTGTYTNVWSIDSQTSGIGASLSSTGSISTSLVIPANAMAGTIVVKFLATNTATGCSNSTLYTFTVKEKPVITIATPVISNCEGVSTPGKAIFNFTAAGVSALPTTAGISYHTSASDAQNNLGAITSPYLGSNNQIIYVRASNGACFAVSTFTLVVNPTPAVPTLIAVAPTCTFAGSSTISNYSSTNTYTFSPAGPTVGAGGLITGMTVGLPYTVTSGIGACTSVASVSFSNAAMLETPAVPTITSTAASCAADEISSIGNYDGTVSYTFSPAGPSVI